MNWEPVEIGGKIFQGNVGELIGIEVCTNYDPNVLDVKSSKRKSPKVNTNTVKKRKITEIQNNVNKQATTAKDIFSPSKHGNTSDSIEEKTTDIQSDVKVENLVMWENFGLPQSILRALQDLNFTQPTEIQQLTLPAATLGRRDILGAAETGSGKTLAFGLPILAGILKVKSKDDAIVTQSVEENEPDSEESEFEMDASEIRRHETGCTKSVNIVTKSNSVKPLYALILTPTRELAVQIRNHLVAVAKYTGINIAVVVGGMAAVKQERILSKGPEIVVATPGRLWELIQQGNSHLSQIDSIRYLAIDETDRMLERGHFQELHDLLERINLDESRRKRRQNFVFSATLTLVHELPRHLKTKVKLAKSKKIHDMTPEQKLKKIIDVLGITEPKVVDITQGTDCHPLPLHASMQQRQRLKNLERFRDVENSVLVATDVAARGLDIPCVEHVIHYQTPRTSESYVHRSGRTARASRQGITVLLVEPNELQNYLRLCRTLQKNEDLPTFPVQGNYLKSVRQRVDLARELDKLQLQVKKTNSEAGWFQKAAEDMDIIVDDLYPFHLSARRYDSKDAEQSKKLADLKRKQLTKLLSTPIFPKGFTGKYIWPSSDTGEIPFQGELKKEKAIDVMKNVIETNKKQKGRIIPLYKPKKRIAARSNVKSIKLPKKESRRKQIQEIES
ncbi:hypothetical protein NQ315_009307 [Exocentrus adspersus]|uniref:ATP-dependent RNA helicase n=1 Tax=Exocentrus adspersus TaxID=1586481 RepID=A0AAV8WGI4_9CUCU|nr:hypothetical protein NQ315_009307 [Exocentrus adspersus]